AVIQSVSQSYGGIGFVGLAYLSPGVKAIAVSYDDGKHYVLRSLENGKKKLYPVVRPLYYYYNVAYKEKVTPFM
ncbi:phosphate ABC transporter substrate-binding protein, partial [Phocaeicola vulgatus]|nr:phosphate ABC transporter substrate-binding protein [Phocaeicola vulgatus]